MALVYHIKVMKRYIIGIDEVGRGPLAGPITIAAVLKPDRFVWKNFKDSKKLSPEKRNKFFLKFQNLNYHVASVGPTLIDKIGLSAAARLAVGRCLKRLKTRLSGRQVENCLPTEALALPKPTAKRRLAQAGKLKILLDGSLFAPKTYLNQETIIKGDEKIPIIAVASIIAKVKRDRHMIRMHKKFPQYGFAIHKGYGTKLHQEAIRQYGICEFHRKSFCRKFI